MENEDIFSQVGALVTEERALRDRATGQGLGEDGQARLRELEARLDQCWDLLRRRRARAEYGERPDEALPGPPEEAENSWD